MGILRILLVDDNVDFLETAARFLAAEPGLVILDRARSGPEAIEKARVLQPDVIIMDLAMPGMTGLEATRRIKAQSPATKIVLISMYDSAEHRLAAADAGVDGYLGKWEFFGSVLPLLRALMR